MIFNNKITRISTNIHKLTHIVIKRKFQVHKNQCKINY